MLLQYEYDFITDVIRLWHAPLSWPFFYDLFQVVSFLPNVFGLMFRFTNQIDLHSYFWPKIANWRAIYIYFMTCSLNINEFWQVLCLFDNSSFLFSISLALSLLTRAFEFELYIYIYIYILYIYAYIYICICIYWMKLFLGHFTVTSCFYYQQLI